MQLLCNDFGSCFAVIAACLSYNNLKMYFVSTRCFFGHYQSHPQSVQQTSLPEYLFLKAATHKVHNSLSIYLWNGLSYVQAL